MGHDVHEESHVLPGASGSLWCDGHVREADMFSEPYPEYLRRVYGIVVKVMQAHKVDTVMQRVTGRQVS